MDSLKPDPFDGKQFSSEAAGVDLLPHSVQQDPLLQLEARLDAMDPVTRFHEMPLGGGFRPLATPTCWPPAMRWQAARRGRTSASCGSGCATPRAARWRSKSSSGWSRRPSARATRSSMRPRRRIWSGAGISPGPKRSALAPKRVWWVDGAAVEVFAWLGALRGAFGAAAAALRGLPGAHGAAQGARGAAQGAVSVPHDMQQHLDQPHLEPHYEPPHRVHSSYRSASLDHVHDVPLNLMSVSVKPPPHPYRACQGTQTCASHGKHGGGVQVTRPK